jgi:hypothetical protein
MSDIRKDPQAARAAMADLIDLAHRDTTNVRTGGTGKKSKGRR